MEPLSAVSLVGTVVQFLDFGIKLVAKTKEIYNSSEGAEIRTIELDAIAQNLVSLNRRVSIRSHKLCASGISEDERALEAITTQCNKIGEELIDALQKTKVQGAHKRYKSVRQALKSVLGPDKIQDLYDRLKQYREQIVVALLVITSAKQKELDKNVQGVKQKVSESEARIIDESRQSRSQILNAIQRSKYSPNKQQDVTTVLELLSDMNSRTSEMRTKEAVLNSLYYPRMQDRREWISEAHIKTFNWVLESKTRGPTPWSDLKKWLRQEDGIYWLNGKAGSGKSTLMKYINQDERTRKYLEEWASPMTLVLASFYFWNSGTLMQKSQLGLLQCLLYEVLVRRPNLIPKVLPMRCQLSNAHGVTAFAWTVSELSHAFEILAITELETKFCFIIDGLDEFDGHHPNLINLLFSMTRTSNMKVLASSRPWLVYQDAFENSPKLILQDLTHDDIQVFAHESLYNHSRFDRLLSLEPDRAPKLLTEIVDKASGVFLWVRLVVRSLMEGLTNADRIHDMQRRLKELPADLEQFFLHILTSLDSFYLHQASQLFRLALEAQKPLSVLTFSYLDEDDPDFALKREIKPISHEEEAARCDTIERRLNSRCKGLLESRRRQSCDEYSNSDGMVGGQISYEVDFLHRSVRDFLNTPTVRIRLVALDTPEFNANMTLTRAFVAQIKGLNKVSNVESNFQALWNLVLDALYHISRVGNDVSPEAQVALLDELNRAAAYFKDVAIVKRRCDPTAHWVNTGYRFGWSPEWNNDFLTLCIQYNLVPYVRQKLFAGVPLGRAGKPLLAFAMTSPTYNISTNRYEKERNLYNAPQLKMVNLLLDRGADPNEMDGKETIWARYLTSLYTLATISESQFYKQIKDWFKVTKLLLINGASHQISCSITVSPGKIAARVDLGKGTSNVKGVYSALDIIRLVFGGDSGYDIAELEDLLEQQQHHEMCNISNSYLQIPRQGLEQENATRPRSASISSQNSQTSAASWRRPTEEDIIIPLQVETKKSASPVVQNVPLSFSKQKKHWNPKNWFSRKEKKPFQVRRFDET
ncbi:hypothetical protein MMC31_002483 [Peltigera leucophlebia]|nr:hypothetical protein [Peltigera leucophlebia]